MTTPSQQQHYLQDPGPAPAKGWMDRPENGTTTTARLMNHVAAAAPSWMASRE